MLLRQYPGLGILVVYHTTQGLDNIVCSWYSCCTYFSQTITSLN